MSYKICKECEEKKEMTGFARHGRSRDGRKKICRKCKGLDKEKVKSVRERVREYFENNANNA